MAKYILHLTAPLLVLLAGCGKQETTGPAVLARVGERSITTEDFDREVTRRLAEKKPIPGKRALLDQMVEREAALNRARTLGLDTDPEVARMLDNLLIAQLRDRQLEDKLRDAKVDETLLRKTYEDEIERFSKPAKTRLAIIKVASAPAMSATKRSELLGRLADARTAAIDNPPTAGRGALHQGFGELAVRYSEDQSSRYRGGDLGWLDAGKLGYHWPKEVLAAGYALEKEGVSEIIETEDAFYLVKKTDHRPGSVTPFEQVRSSLRQRVLNKERTRIKTAFLAENSRQANVAVHEEALAHVRLPQASPPMLADSPESTPPALPGVAN